MPLDKADKSVLGTDSEAVSTKEPTTKVSHTSLVRKIGGLVAERMEEIGRGRMRQVSVVEDARQPSLNQKSATRAGDMI